MSESKRILLIDDERALADVLAMFLESEGYIVDTATDGKKGLEMARNGGDSYDAIITDVNMAGMNGINIYKNIEESTPELADKFIFVTGDTSKWEDFFKETKRPVLRKPFTLDTLTATIGTLLKT